MLYATVRNRKIHVKRPDTVVQNGVNVDWLQLDMDDEWQSMDSIVCVFMLHYTEESTSTQETTVTTTITEKEVQKEILHTFGKPVMVPWECLEHTGMLSVNCTGYVRDEDGESQKVMTTAYPDSYWEVVQNGPMSGEETLEPTPSLYDQIVAAAGAATAAAADAEEARNQLLQDKANGVFDGKDGESARVTVGNTVTGPPGTSANVYQTGDDNNCVLNFTIPRGDPGPVPSALPNPYPLSLNIEGVQIDYDGSRAVVAQIAPKVDDVGTAIMLQIRNHNESPTAHEDIREAIPEQLPNPYALSLNINGVPVEYDGSQPVVANIETTGNAGGVGSEDVTRAISAHNDDADAHPEIRDMIPIVPGTLPNPFPLTIDYADEDGGMSSVSYAGDRFVSVSSEELTAYPIAQHNQSGEAHQDIRDAIPTVPNALPNPNKLTFTGAVEAEYDGSAAVSVEIPAGESGGGASSPWHIVTELTLDEEMEVTLPVPEEAAGYTQWRAQLAIPKVETAKQFISSTLFFGMSAAIGVPALHASYGIGVVVQADWITGDTRGTYQATFAEFSSATPEFASAPRTSWTIKRAGATDVTDRSVLFKSAISLPAGTILLFLGR